MRFRGVWIWRGLDLEGVWTPGVPGVRRAIERDKELPDTTVVAAWMGGPQSVRDTKRPEPQDLVKSLQKWYPRIWDGLDTPDLDHPWIWMVRGLSWCDEIWRVGILEGSGFRGVWILDAPQSFMA